jgi:hypothetical protein
MPRDGATIFGDLIGKLDVLRVACNKCGRAGRCRLRQRLQWASNHYSVGGAVAQRAPGDCNNAFRQSSGAAFQGDAGLFGTLAPTKRLSLQRWTRAERERAMVCGVRILSWTIAVLLSPALAVAQAPPTKVPVAPLTEQRDPKACAHSDTQTTVGKSGKVDMLHDSNENLSNKLARSGGVICPPEHIDPEIKQPTPPGGAMPVIPPPGSPGGDQSIQPK